MSQVMTALLVAIPPLGADAVAALAVKGTLWLALAALASLALRRAAAAARHLVWALAFAGLVALPLAEAALPPLDGPWSRPLARVTRVAPAAAVAAVEPVSPPLSAPPLPEPALHDRLPFAATTAAPEARTPLRWQAWVLPLWTVGMLAVGAWLVLGLVRLARLERRARPVTDTEWLRLCAAVAAELGVRRPVALLRAEGALMPMTWGWGRPVVLVPADADQWSIGRRRDVLRHELAHVARCDWGAQLVARVACALHWFNPLAWLAMQAMRLERERACDDRVLRAGSRPSDYATHLIELARAFRADAAPAALAMARPSRLAGRLLVVLDGRHRRGAMTGWQVAGCAAIALLALSLMAAASPAVSRSVAMEQAVAAASRPDARSVADGGGMHAGATAEARATTAAGAVAGASASAAAGTRAGLLGDTLAECVGGAPPARHARSVHVNDGMAVSTTVGRCVLRFVAEGRVRFTEDYTDVAWIAPGGSVSLETDNGAVRRELEVVPRGGGLERRYRVDGAGRPYDAEARRWVAGALTVMFRSSGVAAEERARWILQRQGTEALIAELALLQGDYARRRYAQVLLASDRLDAAALARVLEWAGASIASDYELAQVLITAARGPIDPAVQRAFVAAAGSLESDYEIGRVLSTALARADLDAAAAARALEVMEGMESDHELARLLIQWQRRRAIDDALRPVFFRAVTSLGSDYERRRVLASVIGRRDASAPLVADALAAMRGMESDYDVAELLTAVADLYSVAGPLRPAFFAAVGTLDGSYERRRVLEAAAQRSDLAGAALLDVLRAAGEMPAGYDRAEVLIAVASRHRLDDAQRAAFLAAARGLGEYEYGRVMTALDRGRRVGI